MLTKEELSLMEHAVGFPNRNYYFADAGYPDDELWIGLCEQGLAVKGGNSLSSDNVYHVTAAGRRAILDSEPL